MSVEQTQLVYIKGLMSDMDADKIREVEDKFQAFLSYIDKDEEREAIGMLVLARWGIQASIDNE